MTEGREILVGYDASDESKDALSFARRLAPALKAEIVLAYVVELPSPYLGGDPGAYLDAVRDDAEELLASAPGSQALDRRIVASGSAASGLQSLAEESGVAVLVVGATHRGLAGQVVAGATGQGLLKRAPCAVAVAPKGYTPSGSTTIGVACDDSADSRAAIDAAVAIARATASSLEVISVLEDYPELGRLHGADGEAEYFETLRREAEEELRSALACVPPDVPTEGVLLEGNASDVLEERENLALLVLGTSGVGRLRGLIEGSVSSKVVRGAASPVLIVPPETGETLRPR